MSKKQINVTATVVPVKKPNYMLLGIGCGILILIAICYFSTMRTAQTIQAAQAAETAQTIQAAQAAKTAQVEQDFWTKYNSNAFNYMWMLNDRTESPICPEALGQQSKYPTYFITSLNGKYGFCANAGDELFDYNMIIYDVSQSSPKPIWNQPETINGKKITTIRGRAWSRDSDYAAFEALSINDQSTIFHCMLQMETLSLDCISN